MPGEAEGRRGPGVRVVRQDSPNPLVMIAKILKTEDRRVALTYEFSPGRSTEETLYYSFPSGGAWVRHPRLLQGEGPMSVAQYD